MGLVVMIVEGVTGAIINGAEEAVNRRGVSIDMSLLATREIGLVTIVEEAGSTTSIKELGLVITTRPVVARADDTARMETGSLVGSGPDLLHYRHG